MLQSSLNGVARLELHQTRPCHHERKARWPGTQRDLQTGNFNPTAHTPRGFRVVEGVCIGVPAKRRQKRFAHSAAGRKERKGKEGLTWGPPGSPKPGTGRKGVNWGRWVSGSARQGGGHEGWWQGESRAPWAMLVEGNGGISSEASSQTQSWKKKKGKFRKVQAT